MKTLAIIGTVVILLAAGCSQEQEPVLPQEVQTPDQAAHTDVQPAEPAAAVPETVMATTESQPQTAADGKKQECVVGSTMDQVRAIMGEPKAQMRSKDRLIWTYDRGTIEFVNGRVSVNDLLNEEEYAARKAEKEEREAQAAANRQQNVTTVKQTATTSSKSSLDSQRSSIEEAYAARLAAAKKSYDADMAAAAKRRDDTIQRARRELHSYVNRGQIVPPHVYSAESSAARQYDVDAKAAESRRDSRIAAAKTKYDSDMAKLK